MVRSTSPKAKVSTVDFCFLVYIAKVPCSSENRSSNLGCLKEDIFCLDILTVMFYIGDQILRLLVVEEYNALAQSGSNRS